MLGEILKFVKLGSGILSLNVDWTFLNGTIGRIANGTDSVEVAAFLMALWGSTFSYWALQRARKILRDTPTMLEQEGVSPINEQTLEQLTSIAMRRVRQQAFHLLVLGTVLLTTTVTLFMQTTLQQSSIRSYAFAFIAMLMLFRAAVEHWEQRAVDMKKRFPSWSSTASSNRRHYARRREDKAS
jgi:hypothetical protein